MIKMIKQIRGNIVSGVVILIPSVTTLYVFFWLFQKIDSILPSMLNSVLPVVPDDWVPGVGAVLIIILSYFVGISAKNIIGAFFINTANTIISNIPLINKIYLGIQQITNSIGGNNKKLFKRAVLIEYPKENSYCIGFVTSDTTGEIPDKVKTKLVSVFVPTTPNPTSGFLLFLPSNDVIELDMSVETAIKAVMSAGIVNTDDIKKTAAIQIDNKKPDIRDFLQKLKLRKTHSNHDPRD